MVSVISDDVSDFSGLFCKHQVKYYYFLKYRKCGKHSGSHFLNRRRFGIQENLICEEKVARSNLVHNNKGEVSFLVGEAK